MFEKTKEKIKNWRANPYWAPLTEPMKMVAAAAVAPNHEFITKMRKAMDDDNYKYDDDMKRRPKLQRMFKEWTHFSTGMWVTLSAGLAPIVFGLAAGVGAGFGLASAGFGIAAIAAGSIAACGLAAVATPFAIMAAVGFAGACVGLVASPWALGKGVIKAVKHREFQKTKAAVIQTTPALQSATPDATETAARIFSQLQKLPAELRGPVLKSMSESFAASGNGAADRALKFIDAMPDAERTALVAELQKKLAPVFEAVATAQAQESVTLQEAAATMPALKFKQK